MNHIGNKNKSFIAM